MNTFTRELEALINKYSLENGSNTPDFILAKYLQGCLALWNTCITERTRYYGYEPRTGESIPEEFDT